MRKRFELQYELGATPIEKLEIPLNSRDELPPTLRALQHIYTTPELNEKVFDILEREILPTVDFTTGRPGMDLWEILVLGTVRWSRDTNYDHLHHKDNIGLLDEETLNEINELVVKTGHSLKKSEKLNVKVDTYVLETNVHFPTDISLLWDAGRKSIDLISQVVTDADIETGWRKHNHWHKRLKSCYHQAAKLTVGAGRLKPKAMNAALDYLSIADDLNQKIKSTKDVLKEIAESNCKINKFNKLLYFEGHLDTHIELVRRRIIYREDIPHEEKVFSLFEPYTEWIQKGKAGNKVELGLRIAIATDQNGFILSHRVMQKEQDVDIAVPVAKELINNYDIDSLSYDKGCWSPKNYQELKQLVPNVVLPKKGRRNKEETEREHSKQFKALRKQHAAVESDINCLEHHGLNRCPDKGFAHFKRYTSFGVLACNLHKLGNILLEQDRQQLSTKPPLAKAA